MTVPTLSTPHLPGMRRASAREMQLRYLPQSARLEEAMTPRLIRSTALLVSGAIVLFFLWAGVTKLNEIVRAPGEVVPLGFERTVQHLEGGTVRQILTREGATVTKGQVLAQLDSAGVYEDAALVDEKIRALEIQAERFRAFLAGRAPDFSRFGKFDDPRIVEQQRIFDSMAASRDEQRKVLQSQLDQKRTAIKIIDSNRIASESSLAFNTELLNRRKGLFEKGLIAFSQLGSVENEVNRLRAALTGIAEERRRADQEIAEYARRLSAMGAGQRDEIYTQLHAIESETAQNNELARKLANRIERLQIRAPVDGTIKSLSINTIGAVVQPGQALASILPVDEPLVVETKISPRDIAHVSLGQPVQLKVSTYDFARYGWATGTIEYISVNTFAEANGERYYRARVLPDQAFVGNDPGRNPLLPGMTVMSEVITGQKTILQYLFKPVANALSNSMTER